MQEFDFEVEHLPGIKNMAADAMSRMQTTGGDQREGPIDIEIPTLALTLEEDVNPENLDESDVGLPEKPVTLDDNDVAIPIPEEELIEEQSKDTMCK